MSDSARGKWEKLGRKSAGLRKSFDQVLQELGSMAGSTDVDAITGAEIVGREIREWGVLQERVLHDARQVLRSLESSCDEQMGSLEQRLARTLQGNGHEVFGSSSLLVIDGAVHVTVGDPKTNVQINGVAIPDRAVGEIANRVEGELKEIERLSAAPQNFLESLAKAYENEIAVTGRSLGDQVEALSLLWQLVLMRQAPGFRADPRAKSFKEYPLPVFRAELRNLMASEVRETARRCFKHSSGSSTKGSVFMLEPTLGRMAHVGRIWFESVGT